ncbi:MAG: hypothetical protein ACRBCK_07230 [Alphaproteobacteria bacterium]
MRDIKDLKNSPTEDRQRILSNLLVRFTMLSRSNYTEADLKLTTSLPKLRASNEIVHVLSKQLKSEIDNQQLAYPYDALMEVLKDHAKVGNIEDILRASMDALKDLPRN